MKDKPGIVWDGCCSTSSYSRWWDFKGGGYDYELAFLLPTKSWKARVRVASNGFRGSLEWIENRHLIPILKSILPEEEISGALAWAIEKAMA